MLRRTSAVDAFSSKLKMSSLHLAKLCMGAAGNAGGLKGCIIHHFDL
jgi:hypothetical protein